MTRSKCFACGKDMDFSGKSMQELIALQLPIFCNETCAEAFPYNDTEEFDIELKKLHERYHRPVLQPDPLKDKRYRFSDTDKKEVYYFRPADIEAAVLWLKAKIKQESNRDKKILDNIDEAFYDILNSGPKTKP